MNILDLEKFKEDVNKVIENQIKVSDHVTSTLELNDKKEENGSVYFKIVLKKDKNEKKIALYIFERKNGITTFIINGDTMDLLFENATIQSPQISLAYLDSIIKSDVTWLKNTKPKKAPAKKNFKGGKKPYNKNKQKPKTGESSQHRYDKNGKPTPNRVKPANYRAGGNTYKKYNNSSKTK